MAIDAHKLGGAPLDANPAPAPTKDTTSIKLIGVAKKAATAEPKALELRAEGKVWHRLKLLSQKDLGEPGSLPQEAPRVGMHRHDQLPRENPSEGKRRPKQVLQKMLQAGMLAAQKSVLTILMGMTPGFPEEDPS